MRRTYGAVDDVRETRVAPGWPSPRPPVSVAASVSEATEIEWPPSARAPVAPEPEAVRPRRGRLHATLALARPRQWIKNLLVIAAAGAAGALGTDGVLLRVGLAFVAFCLMSAGIYALNDSRDVDEDRQHPRKRFRPIAAGELSDPGGGQPWRDLVGGRAVALLPDPAAAWSGRAQLRGPDHHLHAGVAQHPRARHRGRGWRLRAPRSGRWRRRPGHPVALVHSGDHRRGVLRGRRQAPGRVDAHVRVSDRRQLEWASA